MYQPQYNNGKMLHKIKIKQNKGRVNVLEAHKTLYTEVQVVIFLEKISGPVASFTAFNTLQYIQ